MPDIGHMLFEGGKGEKGPAEKCGAIAGNDSL